MNDPDFGRIAGTTLAMMEVLSERRRQIEVHNRTPDYDDTHDAGTLAGAGAAYAAFAADELHPMSMGDGDYFDHPPSWWPWDSSWWRPSRDPRRNLIKAGALILAEIERIDRAAIAKATGEQP